MHINVTRTNNKNSIIRILIRGYISLVKLWLLLLYVIHLYTVFLASHQEKTKTNRRGTMLLWQEAQYYLWKKYVSDQLFFMVVPIKLYIVYCDFLYNEKFPCLECHKATHILQDSHDVCYIL